MLKGEVVAFPPNFQIFYDHILTQFAISPNTIHAIYPFYVVTVFRQDLIIEFIEPKY